LRPSWSGIRASGACPWRPPRSAVLTDALTPAGDLRTLPSHLRLGEDERSGLDGFFAARLIKG
jgi:16S rRNA (cytosine967-C5)-methyltransferase